MPITTNHFPSRRPRTHRAYIPHPTFPRAPGWPITTNRFPSRRPPRAPHQHKLGLPTPASIPMAPPRAPGPPPTVSPHDAPARAFPTTATQATGVCPLSRTAARSLSPSAAHPAVHSHGTATRTGATTATVVMRFAARRAL